MNRDAAKQSGCYRCGGKVKGFGGSVTPTLHFGFGRGLVLGRAKWWTDCASCGIVLVEEPHA